MAEVHALTREAPAGPRRMKSDESSTAACASVGWVVAFRLAIVFSLVVGSDHQPSWRAVATFVTSGGHATYRRFRTQPRQKRLGARWGQKMDLADRLGTHDPLACDPSVVLD